MEFTKMQLEVAAYYLVHGNDDHGWVGGFFNKVMGHGDHGKISSTEEAVLRKAWGKRKEEDLDIVRKEFNSGNIKWDEIVDQVKVLSADEKYKIYFLVCRGMIQKSATESSKEKDGWETAYKFRDAIGIDSAGYTNWVRG